MGVNNRQRRAAKAKQRAKAGGRRRAAEHEREQFEDWVRSPRFQVGAASLALRELVLGIVHDHPSQQAEARFARFDERFQQLAVDDQIAGAVSRLVGAGWTPLDLDELARRKLSQPAAERVRGQVAAHTARFAPTRVHPEWAAQLRGVSVDDDTRGWAARTGLPWPAARAELVEMLALLCSLPVLETVLPAPGSVQSGPSGGHVDERILAKVRALLSKAEATEFEHEAEALTTKAQQLMSAYSIERSLAEAEQPTRGTGPVVRRVWLDAPYLEPKAMLVNQIARNNRCRCVFAGQWGHVTLVGFAADLDAVELLATSLLMQATRAMTATGSHVTRYGTSRTRSFRKSFLVAYGTRIGERLREAAEATEARADADHDGRLLPVLIAREDRVHAAFCDLFPELDSHSISVGDRAGWGAGRAAANLALFDIHDALAG